MTEPRADVGLDTSVILRLLLGVPEDQARVALRFVGEARATGMRVVASDLVLTEAYFALHTHYEVSKREALEALLEMLRSGLIEPGDGPGVLEILATARRAPAKPGFVDRLIHAQYEATSRRMVTFEHAAARLAATIVLRGGENP